MKEKINQLETLLNEITQAIEHRLSIKKLSVDDVNKIFEEEEYFEVRERMLARINDPSFFDVDIPKLKDLVSGMLSKLNDINNNFDKPKFGSKLRSGNSDFIKLLEQEILASESNIYLQLNKNIYSGSLTENGYFNLNIKGEMKPFSSLATAASFINDKPILKGWKVWFAKDKNGIEHNLEFFRKQII